jgi:hypothetical protein
MAFRTMCWLVVAAAWLAGSGVSTASPSQTGVDAVVLVSANAEWAIVKSIHPRETFADLPLWLQRAAPGR